MLTACSSATASQIPTDAPLPAHTAVYEVLRRGSKIGEIHTSLSVLDNDIWHFDTSTVATARLARVLRVSAEESAHFVWTDGQVQMLTYRQVARGPTRTRFWQHELDWAERVSNTHTYEGDHVIELEDGVLDPLTLRLQLAVTLADPAKRGSDLEFRVLERDEIEDQHFFFRGEEVLDTPVGCFDTVRMERFRREGSSRNYDSWHSASFHWLPLRILQTKDEREELDIRLIETELTLDTVSCPPH
jgi:hypothetical protein